MDAISNGILLKSLERPFGSNLIPTILALFLNRVWTVLTSNGIVSKLLKETLRVSSSFHVIALLIPTLPVLGMGWEDRRQDLSNSDRLEVKAE